MRTTAIFTSVLGSALLALTLSGCDGTGPDETASLAASEEAIGTETGTVPADEIAGAPSGGASDVPAALVSTSGLDVGALAERRDPERVLRFYANALRARDWAAATRAWTLDAQMTPEKLASRYGSNAAPKLTVGKGDVEGAAGSLYYEAPVVIDFGDGKPSRRGSIILRRVNDVPGASDEQLNWRIERSSIMMP